MSRVRKPEEYEAKKNQIVLEAVNLLDQIGYEQFSINKVIASAGMTKGAFFHYFNTKNELIAEIVNLILNPMFKALEEIANDKTIEPKNKILKMSNTAYRIKGTDKRATQQLIRLLQKKENNHIMQMVTDHSIKQLLPVYEKVFIEGNDKGQFNIQYPNGSAFMFLTMLTSVNREIGEVLYKENIDPKKLSDLKQKVTAFEVYSKDLFNFDDTTQIYNHDLLKIDLK
jgi:AcrR family transcriptional regulator